MKYFAKIKYLGTDFHGFQAQPSLRTVQGELTSSFELAFGKPCKVTGCSRTDAGVHANEYCITVECDGSTVPADKLPIAVMKFLPKDIALVYAEECSEDFHPRYSCVKKEYLYRIINKKVCDPFEYGRAYFVSREITDGMLERMSQCAKSIIGKHDFSAFMAKGSDVTDTVRTVHSLEIQRNGDVIEIKVSADGFLYNMVRIIVGTLLEVAFGRLESCDVEKIIESRERKNAGMTAPAEGLYLNKVYY